MSRIISWLLDTAPRWYETILKLSSPFFAIFEGFATMLVAQSIIGRYFTARSESAQLGTLFFSSSVFVGSLGLLVSTYADSAKEPINATLIGSAVTGLLFVSGLSFVSSGSRFVVESSLMFAYVVFHVKLLAEEGPDPLYLVRSLQQADIAPLPPAILQSFRSILQLFTSLFGQSFDVLLAAASTLPTTVALGLIFRLAILIGGARVVIALKRGRVGYTGSRRLSQEDPLMFFFSVLLGYSRLILVCVYTHLLLLDSEHQEFWRWVNVACTIILFAVETQHTRVGWENDDEIVVRGFGLARSASIKIE